LAVFSFHRTPYGEAGSPCLIFRAYPNNRVVMRPSENLSAYGGVRGQGGRPKMLARSGFLHVVENVLSPTTQASGFP